MHIKSINVCNFRKFIQPVSISGLTGGINIIAGDNEDGKSTIVQAIKAAFYTKHSTSATQPFQPYGSSALPEVSVLFDLGGTEYALRKSFGKKGAAELRGASTVFNNSEAEEQLQQLLALGSEKTRDNTSIWNVLWVEQGTAFYSPEIGEIGKRTLTTALENELGKMVSGNESHALLQRINELYLQWFTKKSGQAVAGSELKKSEKELAELKEIYDRRAQEYESYKSTLERMQHVRTRLNTHEHEDTLGRAKQHLDESTRRHEEIAKQTADLQRLKAEEAAETAQYQTVSRDWQNRDQLSKSLVQNEAALAAVAKQVEESKAKSTDVARQLHECQQSEEQAEQASIAAEARYEELETSARRSQLTQKRTQIEHNLNKAREAQKQAAEFRNAANAIKIDRATIEKLRALERQLLQSEAQLEAVGTKLEFRPTGSASVKADGHAIDISKPLSLSAPTTFDLDGWGQIAVTPGGEGIDKIRESAASARQAFEALLAKSAVESIEAAEQLEREKTEKTTKSGELLRDVLKYAPAGIPALEEELTTVASQLRSVAAGESPQIVDDKDLDKARAERDKCRQAALAARRASQGAAKLFSDLSATIQTLAGQEKTLAKAVQDAKEKLDQARQSEGDSQLEQRLLEARKRMEEATKLRQELETLLAGANATITEQAMTAARAQVEQIQREVQLLREEQSQLSGSLQTFGKAGIAEEFQKAADKKEQLEATVAKLQKRAAAVKLLFETITEAERNSKAELLEPLIKHLQPYVADVFDKGKVTFDKATFSITNLQRDNCAEDYNALSLGTREQLSVLMRLSFAHVLSENKCPAVVILDDALVYSDETRFEKMQQALRKAGNAFQILILTCRIRDWQNLDAPVIKLEECMQSKDRVLLFSPGQTSPTAVKS